MPLGGRSCAPAEKSRETRFSPGAGLRAFNRLSMATPFLRNARRDRPDAPRNPACAAHGGVRNRAAELPSRPLGTDTHARIVTNRGSKPHESGCRPMRVNEAPEDPANEVQRCRYTSALGHEWGYRPCLQYVPRQPALGSRKKSSDHERSRPRAAVQPSARPSPRCQSTRCDGSRCPSRQNNARLGQGGLSPLPLPGGEG